MDAIRKFNRFELKYLLSYEIAMQLKHDLERYMKKDPHGKYPISSLYYDTFDHRFYWEKIEGLKFRRKLRIRRYVNDKPFDQGSPVFLEIKQRVDRVVQKRRAVLPYGVTLDFLNKGTFPKHDPRDRAVLEEIEMMMKLQNLRPAVITSYDREALVGTEYDAGLRITFDTHVSYRHQNLDLSQNFREGYMVTPDKVIMEIKVNERIPYWVTELVAKHNFRLVRVSKYCQGLESASVLPQSFYYIN